MLSGHPHIVRVSRVVVVVFSVVLAGSVAWAGPVSIVLDSPADGGYVALGKEIIVSTAATAEAGVSQVVLAINGVAVRSDAPPDWNPTSCRMSLAWTPVTPGRVVLSVIAFDRYGRSSNWESISLRVVSSGLSDIAGETEKGAAKAALEYATFSVTGDSKQIGPGLTDSATALCPAPAVLVGGGYRAYSTWLVVFGQQKVKGAWAWGAINTNPSQTYQMNGTAVCLTNASSASVIQEHGQVDVTPGATATAVATCPAGSIVTGGGFYDDSEGELQVTESHKARVGEGWQSQAHNPTGSTKTHHAYALCLSGIEGSSREVEEPFEFSASVLTKLLTPTCNGDELLTSGGFSADLGVTVNRSWGPSDGDWQLTASGSPGLTIHAYATCVKLGIFFDGFESGDFSMWSSIVP